jgi:SAM-dependent methyltransferase
MALKDSTLRFSSRVENYIRYRPGYPPAMIDLLKTECGLTSSSVVADIGSGTGKLTELFLKHGNRVFGVEPNADMRRAGEQILAGYPAFVSIDGTAEATTLPDHSVNFVAAGQAAHWFDRQRARAEFVRILKPGGWVALTWNDRYPDTPFLKDYEQLLVTYGTDYLEVSHEHATDSIGDFFAPSPFHERRYAMSRTFDYSGLEGRLLSSSYTPQAGDARYEPMLAELRRIFEKHSAGGHVTFQYDNQVFYGQLS